MRKAPGLTSSGEFGPILGAVIDDLLHSGLRWQRWERGSSAPAAVFSYAVAAGESHFAVGITNGNKVETIHPAYHGEVEIDPETGAILSLIEVADMAPPHETTRAAIAVYYAPVTIGNGSFICPVRAVAFSEIQVPTVARTNVDSAPVQINLNDVAFTQYHRFGTETRMVWNAGGNEPAEGSQTQTAEVRGSAISPGAPAATTAPAASAGTAAVVMAQPAVTHLVNSTAAQITQAVAAPAENSSSTKEAEPAAASAAPPESVGKTKDGLAGGTVLHVESRLVLVDVVVTDHDRPMRGLSRDRFHILENGHEQPIASFVEHEPSARITVSEPPALPSNTYSNVPAYPETSAVNVLLLDALNTPMGDQERVRRAMIEYLGTIRPGTPLAIFTLSSRLRMAAGFTTDVAQLVNVLQRQKARPHATAGAGLSGDSSLSTSLTQEASQINATATRSGDPLTAWLVNQVMNFAADNKTHENDERVMITLNALSQLSKYLAAIPGRKNLIWFSGSFPAGLTPGALNSAALKDVSDYSFEVRRTNALLTAARVSVYPVDARGVTTAPAADATYIPPPAGMGSSSTRLGVQSDNNSFTVQTLQDQGTMDTIATETGGHAYSAGNDLSEALKKITATDSSYYALSYVPPEEKKDKNGGGFHRIEVKVDGARYQLAYRRGYYADDTHPLGDNASGAASLKTEAMELGAPPSTQILFQARVLRAGDAQFMGAALDDKTAGEKATGFPGGIHRYVVDLSVQPQSLTFAEGAGGARSTQLQCGLAAYNGQGEAVNSLFRTFDINLRSEEYERLRATDKGIPVRLALDLPAGEVTLRIVVYASGTVKTGSLEIPVQTTGGLPQGKH
jgi:VWFA-related protein